MCTFYSFLSTESLKCKIIFLNVENSTYNKRKKKKKRESLFSSRRVRKSAVFQNFPILKLLSCEYKIGEIHNSNSLYFSVKSIIILFETSIILFFFLMAKKRKKKLMLWMVLKTEKDPLPS